MKKWSVASPDKKIVSELVFGCKISSLAASVLASRGFSSPQQVIDSMQVDELSDPFLIRDMDSAADTVNEAVDNNLKICIYGDYDCDGIMASVMLYLYLSEIGADVYYYIPERAEGYGLNKNAIKTIAENGTDLIITVDNGIAAIDEAEYIYELGMKLVVTDHHQPGEILPKAEAVVDPHRNDCMSPFKYLCGAGVVLKLIAALDGGDYTLALEQFGDLAAIATVADIVSLSGENRFIVSYGINLIENSDRPSIIALKNVCGLNDKVLDSYSIGFGIAPRINASGRFGSPKTAAQLFICEDSEQAESLANELNRLNNERKETENVIMAEIFSMLDANPDILRQRVIFICGKNWHHGVIGIVASKIVETFGKPCFIASESNGEIRGSARSFGEFSVFRALSYCADALEKFGGHVGAGGFTIHSDSVQKFNSLLQQYALINHVEMPEYCVKADAPASPAELTPEAVNGLKVLEPFGCDNEKPLFYIKNTLITDISPLKDSLHSKLRLKYGNASFNAFIFRTSPSDLSISQNEYCDFIVSLDTYSFKGSEYVSAVVKDYSKNPSELSSCLSQERLFEAALRNESVSSADKLSLMPVRDMAAAVYKRIPDGGISLFRLFMKLDHNVINYGKFLAAVEAMRQTGLVAVSSASDSVKRLPVTSRVDLMSAPIINILS